MALSDLTISGVLPTDWASTVLPPAIRAEVAVVVEAALSTDSGVSPKVVVKTLALFQIDHIGLAVVMVYAKKLVVAGAYVSVLKCVEHFTWMPWPHMDMLEAFVATKSWPMAEQLLKIIQPALDGPTFRHLTMSLVTLSTQQQELKRVEVLSRDVRCWVGVDVEWKAVFDKTEMAMASILQIAVGSKVFIVDVIALEVY
ncbi:hypothetical protein DYB38_004777 [Aphanomyces astaci]|uniref:Uncharacterized protein n=1 Tax=Aphanomyces astaci TaxID=112090 RepID=A0A397AT54_APHAT|nr:hypothetical protein DYB36_008552 [Aphanomyces astaci]RHY55111.1 hypothetical protein DYB38_004777 [Aphanomyces astaci]